jgi:DNA repair exonuclease SbcCD ATPase subunit
MIQNIIFGLLTISLLFAVISSIIFWGYIRGHIKRKNDREEKYHRAIQMSSEAKRIQWEGTISELNEHITATRGELLQLEKKYSSLLKVFKEWFDIVKHRQSEIEDRLTLGMKSNQEIKSKLDELSNADINLNDKLSYTTQALGEKEGLIRSYRAEMETLMLDLRTRIDDFDANYQSFKKNDQEIERKIEQLASKILETEDKFSNINQMSTVLGEKLTSVAKTLDENDSIFRAYQKETEDLIRDLTGKINELSSHSEHFQAEFHEMSFQRHAMNDSITGIHETINLLKNDFMHKFNSSYTEIVDQMSVLKTKFDDQYLVNDRLAEKGRIIELNLKDINDSWEKLHEQQLTKYGGLLAVIEDGKSRVQIIEEQLIGIKEIEGDAKKSIQDLLGEFSTIQRDLQSVKEELSMKQREHRITENKLDMIKKIVIETETEIEEQGKK